MDAQTALVATDAMRSNPVYQAAETLRRATSGGSAALATALPTTPDHGAVLMLINTWEAIAILLDGVDDRDSLFDILPVCHMYDVLSPAITILRKASPYVAANFETLNTTYHAWFKTTGKSAEYVTAACGGIHAKFG